MAKKITQKGTGGIFKVLALIPGINWFPLLYLGIVNKDSWQVIMALVYAMLTYKSGHLFGIVYILAAVHYFSACAGKKSNNDRKKIEKKNEHSDAAGQEIHIEADVHVEDEKAKKAHIENRELFYSEMKRYENREGEEVPFVRFMSSEPTYQAMNEEQQAWYFYWRGQVRQGIYPEFTTTSYIYVYACELISGIGWLYPREGYEQLRGLRQNYGHMLKEMNRQLGIWMNDFVIAYDMEIPDDMDIYEHKSRKSQNNMLLNKWMMQKEEQTPLSLPFALIEAMTSYRITDSEFYQANETQSAMMREAMPRVIAQADTILRKQSGRGLLESFAPYKESRMQCTVFEDAMSPEADKKVRATMKDYAGSQELGNYMNGLARYAEDVLKDKCDNAGILQSITVDEKLAEQVSAFLTKV